MNYYNRINGYCKDLYKQLTRHSRVEVPVCSQISFDEELTRHHMRKDIDYTRQEIVLSEKGHRRHIEGYVYEIIG